VGGGTLAASLLMCVMCAVRGRRCGAHLGWRYDWVGEGDRASSALRSAKESRVCAPSGQLHLLVEAAGPEHGHELGTSTLPVWRPLHEAITGWGAPVPNPALFYGLRSNAVTVRTPAAERANEAIMRMTSTDHGGWTTVAAVDGGTAGDVAGTPLRNRGDVVG